MTDDLPALQGTWSFVSLEVEGSAVPAAVFASSRMRITGNRFETVSPEATYSGTFAVNASARPKTIDMHFTGGPHAGQFSYGIYELDGDTWRICLGFAGRVRPADFASEPGSGHALETLQRESPRRPADGSKR